MPTINELILEAIGDPGTLNERLFRWAGGQPGETLNEAVYRYLGENGGTGTLDERWLSALGAAGYTGTINERLMQFFAAGGVFREFVYDADGASKIQLGYSPSSQDQKRITMTVRRVGSPSAIEILLSQQSATGIALRQTASGVLEANICNGGWVASTGPAVVDRGVYKIVLEVGASAGSLSVNGRTDAVTKGVAVSTSPIYIGASSSTASPAFSNYEFLDVKIESWTGSEYTTVTEFALDEGSGTAISGTNGYTGTLVQGDNTPHPTPANHWGAYEGRLADRYMYRHDGGYYVDSGISGNTMNGEGFETGRASCFFRVRDDGSSDIHHIIGFGDTDVGIGWNAATDKIRTTAFGVNTDTTLT